MGATCLVAAVWFLSVPLEKRHLDKEHLLVISVHFPLAASNQLV